jgi:hypothetical protein
VADNSDVQYIKLPDGSYGKFPASAPDDQISSILSAQFPKEFAQSQAQPSLPVTPEQGTISATQPSFFDSARRTIANSAIGHAVQQTMPKVADTLGLTPTETVYSPTYQAHQEQLIAPDELVPASATGPVANVTRGVLQGAGGLTSGPAMATMAGAAATGGLLSPAVPAIGRMISLGFSVQTANDVAHRAPQLLKMDPTSREFATELGRLAFDTVMLKQMALHAATGEPIGMTPDRGAETLRGVYGDQPTATPSAIPLFLRRQNRPATQVAPETAPAAGGEQPAPRLIRPWESTEPDLNWIARSGNPGIGIEDQVKLALPDQPEAPLPNAKAAVYRDEQGNAIGALKFDIQDGKPANLQVYVDPRFRQTGIASSLYDAAQQAGYDVESVSGQAVTPDGKAFLEARRAKVPAPAPVDPLAAAPDNLVPTTPEALPPAIPEFAKGPGAKTEGPSEVPGTPLQQLTDWLPNVVSPHATPLDRMKTAVANVQQKLGYIPDAVSRTLTNAEASVMGLWDSYNRPPQWTDFKDAVGKWQGGLQYSSWELQKFAEALKEQMPDKVRREALTNYIQADGDRTVLSERASKASPELKPAYDAALTLDPTEKTLAQNVRGYLDAQLEEAQRAGMLENGVDNYISQLWTKNPAEAERIKAMIGASELQTKPFFTKERVFQSYFEGEDAGFIPKDKDVGFLLSAYHQSFAKAIADRGLVKQLMEAKASDGRPLVATSGVGTSIPEGEISADTRAHLILPNAKPEAVQDYISLDEPALRRWKWMGTAEDGKPIFLQGDLVVHPEAYQKAKNLLGESAIRKNAIGRAALRLSSEYKNTMLSLSAFHNVTVAVHALEHMVNPFTVSRLDLNDEHQMALVNHGLQVADFSAMEGFSEGVAGSGLINKIPWFGALNHKYQAWLFKKYIPELKLTMALHALERNRGRYGDKLNEDQLFSLTAQQSNAAFGEQSTKMLMRNKTLQDTMRLILLAPDFLESRAKFFGQALRPFGAEQRWALLRGAVAMYIGGRLVNQVLNGNPELDPSMAFSIRVGQRVYNLKSVQTEFLHLVLDPRQFAYARANPMITKTLIEYITGRDERGRKRDAGEQLKDLALGVVPISFQSLTKPQDFDAKEAILKATGVSGRRYQTPAERKATDLINEGAVFAESNRSPAEQKLVQKHRNSIEAGKFDAGAVRRDVQAGKLTERDAKTLTTEAKTPRLVRNFSRLPLEKALEVWNAANDEERKALRPLLQRKGSQLDNRIPVERQKLRQQLTGALNEKSAPQQAIPAMFKRVRNAIR